MSETSKPIVIGIVGGVASGKSTLTRLFEKKGARIVSADQIGHDVLCQPDVIEQLRTLFGDCILCDTNLETSVNPSIDRKKLALLVFGKTDEKNRSRHQLESVVHPRIRQIAKDQLTQWKDTPGIAWIVLDAPLLIEGGWVPYCDRMIFVDTPEKLRREWALARGWTEDEWKERESAQRSLEEKRSLASEVIVNSGSLAELEEQLDQLCSKFSQRSPMGSSPR
jgi:dephospho-CoA kinase